MFEHWFRVGANMTSDTKVGAEGELYSVLLRAAGPDRVLGLTDLRAAMVGVDPALCRAALARVVEDGVHVPAALAAAFGVAKAPEPQTHEPSVFPAAAATRHRESEAVERDERTSAVHRWKFTLGVTGDEYLDLSALSIHAIRTVHDPRRRSALADRTPPPRAAAPATAPPGSAPGEPGEAPVEEGPLSTFDVLKHYQHSVGRYPLIDRRRETELAEAIEAGLLAREKLDQPGGIAPKLRRELGQLVARGERAYTEFAQANLRLVVSIARKFTGRGVELLDLIQEGNLGMLHAIDKFDHRKGHKFSTYAVPWIHQTLLRAIADKSRTVRLPVHAHDSLRVLHRVSRDLNLAHPSEDVEAVAGRAGVTVDEVRKRLSRVRTAVPLEALREAVGDDGLHEEADRTLLDAHPGESDGYYRNLSPETVQRLLGKLTAREVRVLSLRHGLDGGPEHTLEVIGTELGVTRERVRQIEHKASVALREAIAAYQSPEPPVNDAAAPDLAEGTVRRDAGRHRSAVHRPSPTTPSVSRKVHASGHIMVDSQSIRVGPGLKGRRVTVFVEASQFRVFFEGRQVASAARQRRRGSGKIYGSGQ